MRARDGQWGYLVMFLSLLGGCGDAPIPGGLAFDQAAAQCASPVDPSLSLFVTDPTVMAGFPIQKLMNQIAATGSKTGQTGLDVYRQLVDTLNTKATGVTTGPHCDDVKNAAGQATLNGFPIECPRKEGSLASTNPFSTNPKDAATTYVPIAVVNRFDLAPSTGDNCGEYRVIYGLRSGAIVNSQNFAPHRFFLIFEATLPNPTPAAGLAACLPVAQFWDALSSDPKGIADVAAQLSAFYFKGLPGFAPVVAAAHYGIGGGTNTGQIRANMFFNDEGEDWQLREFRLSQSPAGVLTAVNTPVANSPYGGLFAGTDAQSLAFQTEFLSQVVPLSASTVPAIAMVTPKQFNAGEANSPDFSGDAQSANFARGANPTFATAVTNQIAKKKLANLSATNLFDRASSQTCAGCHQVASFAPLYDTAPSAVYPASLNFPSTGFTQTNELGQLSPALTQVFLPERAQVLVDFINGACSGASAATVDPTLTVGGSAVGAAN